MSAWARTEAAVDKNGTEEAPNYVLCKNQKTVRSIRVEKEDANECVTLYTKAGIDREVGRAQNFSSCVRIVENIRNNLEKASWQCKEMGNVSITSTVEED